MTRCSCEHEADTDDFSDTELLNELARRRMHRMGLEELIDALEYLRRGHMEDLRIMLERAQYSYNNTWSPPAVLDQRAAMVNFRMALRKHPFLQPRWVTPSYEMLDGWEAAG